MSKRRYPASAIALLLALFTACGPNAAKPTLPAANDEVSTPMMMEDVEASEETDSSETIDADEDLQMSPDNGEVPATSS